ncbi:MerR family transcriptional regulator [Flindersiella endophytica]
MRIAELSRLTGVPVPRIKYYIREGLVDHGERTQFNQATYDESHVKRVKLLRALVSIGGLSIAHTREVLETLDEPNPSIDYVLGHAMPRTDLEKPPRTDENGQKAAAALAALMERRGWRQPERESAGARSFVEAAASLYDLGLEHLLDELDAYASAAESVAAADLAMVARMREPAAILESAVVGTVLCEILLTGLRRMAHSNASLRQFPDPAAEPG